MRNIIIAASLIAIGAPATAQIYDSRVEADIARSLPHPAEVDAMGRAIDRTVGALMSVPVGDVANAIDPYSRPIHPDTRLGELASRGDPYARDRMRGQIGAMTQGMNAMIDRIAVLAPILGRSFADLEYRMGAAFAEADRDRFAYDDYDYDDY